jgi:putative ABC transport system permease protein
MLSNYFKLAFKVLGRNKFFTGISLFGISFTLLILMLITALYDAEFGKNPPLSKKDRMVLLDYLSLQLMQPDTSWQIDSSLVGARMTYDSTMIISESSVSTSNSSMSYYFLDRFMRDPEDVETYTFFDQGNTYDVFLPNGKLSLSAIYADAAYWDVFDFVFLEGNAFTAAQVENASQVAVITTVLARKYFGKETDVLGEEIRLGDRTFKVIGLVERSQSSHPYILSDVYVPLSTQENLEMDSQEYLGSTLGVYLAKTKAAIPFIKEELVERAANAPLIDPDAYNKHTVLPMLYNEYVAYYNVDSEDPAKGLFYLQLFFGTLLLFFLLLPTLNLINLNVSRIMERSSEIGVRKAFGAHSGTILYQFIFENVIITFIGGIIGLILAVILIYVINGSQVLPDITLVFNSRVFLISIVLCFVFGILSGFLPAWRVSRLQIADALNNNIKN